MGSRRWPARSSRVTHHVVDHPDWSQKRRAHERRGAIVSSLPCPSIAPRPTPILSPSSTRSLIAGSGHNWKSAKSDLREGLTAAIAAILFGTISWTLDTTAESWRSAERSVRYLTGGRQTAQKPRSKRCKQVAFFFTMSVRRTLNLCNPFTINQNTCSQAPKVVSLKEYHLFIYRVFYGNYQFDPDCTPNRQNFLTTLVKDS